MLVMLLKAGARLGPINISKSLAVLAPKASKWDIALVDLVLQEFEGPNPRDVE